MSKLSFLFTALTSMSLFGQQKIGKEEFAFGREIESPPGKSVVEITLPLDVYKTTKDKSMQDLAIFNSKNEVVPHVLIMPEGKQFKTTKASVPVKLFPIKGNKMDEGIHFSSIEVTTNNNGSVTEIVNNSNLDKSDPKNSRIIGYLIDASGDKKNFEKLKVDISEFPENEFVHMDVQGSNDLEEWQNIGDDPVLTRFQESGEKVVKDEIDLENSNFKYYRLTWSGNDLELKIPSAVVSFSEEKEQLATLPMGLGVNGTRIENQNGPITYQYDLMGSFPVEAFEVRFNDLNSIARVRIKRAEKPEGPWVDVITTTFYRMMKNSAEIKQSEAGIPVQMIRYFRIELLSNESGIGGKFPEVSVNWSPMKLRFLARGEGPFFLGYGNAKTVNVQQTDLMGPEWSSDVGVGILKDQVPVGGFDKLVNPEESKFPYQKVILWAILVLGVVLLGFMVIQTKK
jgi:hypothetical protein